MPKEKYSYWYAHKYKRRSIKDDFLKFCGWDVLEDLTNSLDPLQCGLVCALFETGGRAKEILTLKPEQFDLRENHVMVLRMKVLKHRKSKDRTFPIPLDDPLLDPLLSYVDTIRKGDLIFPFGYSKLYKIIRDLQKPEGLKHGAWWPHRFRGERATQLVVEKGFGVIQLMKWFGWSRTETPTFYANLSPTDLVKMIVRGE